MDRLSILIAEDDHFVSSSLAPMLHNMGHTVTGCVRSGAAAVDSARTTSPDLILMDIGLEEMNGLQASRQILERQSLPIVVLTAHADPALIEEAEAIGVEGYLVKPFTQNDLRPALTLAWSRFKQRQFLRQEIESLQQSLKERKLIEQAKGLLMQRESISESDAFRRIQQMSRNQNIAMARLAEAIILTEKLANDRRCRRI